jgi:hypothetical protein
MENEGREALAEAEEAEKSDPRRSQRAAHSDGKLKEGDIDQQIQKFYIQEQEIPVDPRNRRKTMTSKANIVGSDTAENTIENEAEKENNCVLDEETPHQGQQVSQGLKRQRTDAGPSERPSKLLNTAPQSAVDKSASQQAIATAPIPYKSKKKAGIEAHHKGKARADKVFEIRRRRLAQERPAHHFPLDTPCLSSQDNAAPTDKPVMGTKMIQQWWEGLNTRDGEREHLAKLC